jgi:uncharacterized protein (TIGR04222 family)
MIRKLSSTFLIILLISLFVASPVQAAKSYSAEYFDVQIDLQQGGSAMITETVKFHFAGDPFTFAFREISARETDGVTFLEASMDGLPMSQGTQAGQVEVEEGDPLKVTWHFAPTSDAAHVFIVRYRVDGVIRKGDGDTLIWRAIPEDHDYSIGRSTITLTYPPNATVLGQPTLSWNFDAAWEENRVVLTASGIAADEDLILTARFAPGSLTKTAPQWQVQKEHGDAVRAKALPVGFVGFIASLIIGGLALLTYIRANGRDLNISPIVSTSNPPSDISPAIIGKLTKQPHTFMGAIFDLAQRGVLEIREEKGLWGAKNYLLVRKDNPVSLKPFEQGLMNALFKPNEIQINMNEVGGRLAKGNNLFDEALEQDLIQRGWLDADRKHKRNTLLGIGWTTLFLVMALFIAALLLGIGWNQNIDLAILFAVVAGVSLGIFILALALLIYAGTFSVLTPAGEEQAARWKGFAEYLKQVSEGREPAIRPDTFERYLAYASVFGLGANWAKYFQKLGGVPLPIWFHAMAGNDVNFAAIVAVMSASDSSGVSGGGSGAGASGGGSSGAG